MFFRSILHCHNVKGTVFNTYVVNLIRPFSTSRICNVVELNAIIDKEASEKFISDKVQRYLKRLTGLNMEKIFRPRALGQKLASPTYKFMTTEQLEKRQKYALKEANIRLQMPPVVPVCSDEPEILEDDPKIIGYDTVNYIFTDITYGIPDRKRIIVVREPGGVLRKADSNERHRMNQVYFPREGRTIRRPRMFEPENLQPLLEKGEYEFILDKVCCQFEPDEPEFHEITFQVYRKVNEQKAFDRLRSTRYYGPLVFYLVLNKNIDNLLIENLQNERIDDAITAIMIYKEVHAGAEKALKTFKLDGNNKMNYIFAFIDMLPRDNTELKDAFTTCYKSVTLVPELEAVPSSA